MRVSSAEEQGPPSPTKAVQPPLPDAVPWPDVTRAWWAQLGELEQAEAFTPAMWLYLQDTAMLHASVWSGDVDRVGELGARLEKFGFTPEGAAKFAQLLPRKSAVSPADEVAARRAARRANAKVREAKRKTS